MVRSTPPKYNPASVSQYFSVRHPEEFDAALKKAQEDGSISTWTWGQVVGKWPPPGTDEHARLFHEN